MTASVPPRWGRFHFAVTQQLTAHRAGQSFPGRSDRLKNPTLGLVARPSERGYREERRLDHDGRKRRLSAKETAQAREITGAWDVATGATVDDLRKDSGEAEMFSLGSVTSMRGAKAETGRRLVT
jgi:hypothetical protein